MKSRAPVVAGRFAVWEGGGETDALVEVVGLAGTVGFAVTPLNGRCRNLLRWGEFCTSGTELCYAVCSTLDFATEVPNDPAQQQRPNDNLY
jgi:hypothetical protein